MRISEAELNRVNYASVVVKLRSRTIDPTPASATCLCLMKVVRSNTNRRVMIFRVQKMALFNLRERHNSYNNYVLHAAGRRSNSISVIIPDTLKDGRTNGTLNTRFVGIL